MGRGEWESVGSATKDAGPSMGSQPLSPASWGLQGGRREGQQAGSLQDPLWPCPPQPSPWDLEEDKAPSLP